MLYASFLDPRYKNILQGELLSDVEMGMIQGEILNQMVLIDDGDLSNESTQSSQETRCEPIAKQAKYDWKKDSSIVSWSSVLQGGVVDLTDGCNTAASAADELNEYMREVVRVSDPLSWWKINAFKFHRLSKLAQRFLAIPATSIPSERTFSVAGLAVSN